MILVPVVHTRLGFDAWATDTRYPRAAKDKDVAALVLALDGTDVPDAALNAAQEAFDRLVAERYPGLGANLYELAVTWVPQGTRFVVIPHDGEYFDEIVVTENLLTRRA